MADQIAEGAQPSHLLSKEQRYNIILRLHSDDCLPLGYKKNIREAEKQRDYSSIDELWSIKCEASLPHDNHMERLWQYYTTPPLGGETAKYTQEQFDWSS